MLSAYEILGILENANMQEIKSAYRKKAFQYHPDKNSSEGAHLKFIEVNEAYEELVEGKSKRSNYSSPTSTYTYEEIIERRNRENREKAEYYAKVKYEEFIAETEEFKSAWYYHFSVTMHYLMVGFIYLIGVLLCISPFFMLFYVGFAGIFAGLFILPLAYSIFQAAKQINQRFSHFRREKGYNEKIRRKKEEAGSTESQNSKWQYWFPYVHFRKYRIAKLSLFLPLFYALIIVADYLLPLKENVQTIISKEVKVYTVHHRKGKTEITVHYFETDKLNIKSEANFGEPGDKLKIKYTPILHFIKECQAYLPVSEKFVKFTVRQGMYSGIFFFILIILIVCYMGFCASFENEISAAVIISYLICIAIYYFVT